MLLCRMNKQIISNKSSGKLYLIRLAASCIIKRRKRELVKQHSLFHLILSCDIQWYILALS